METPFHKLMGLLRSALPFSKAGWGGEDAAVQEASAAANSAWSPTIPPGQRLYVVGDIHGRADLLTELHRQIEQDVATHVSENRAIIVYLGDYIDRGDHSRQVIDSLLDSPLKDFAAIHLCGNHEEYLLKFLNDPLGNAQWIQFGGLSTLLSYGVRVPPGTPHQERTMAMRDQLRQNLPPNHMQFLMSLKSYYTCGDYFCVHAGIRPGLPIMAQSPEDLIWIRSPFLEHRGRHEKMIIHGHTITPEPDIQDNRLGIDTGAYYSGHLTAVVLEGESRRFLHT